MYIHYSWLATLKNEFPRIHMLCVNPMSIHLLQFRVLLAPLLSNFLFSELSGLALQHFNLLIHCEFHLVTHRYQTLCNVLVILP